MQRLISDAHFGQSGLSEVRSGLQENTPVRRALLALIVRHAGQDSYKLWEGIYDARSICPISAADVEALGLEPLNALFKEHEEIQAARRAKPKTAPPDRDERLRLGPKAKAELLGMLEQLRDGSATHGLAWTAGWLLQTNPNSRHGEVHIETLEREAGQEIAQAVRQGFAKVWRTRLPTYQEDKPRTTSTLRPQDCRDSISNCRRARPCLP